MAGIDKIALGNHAAGFYGADSPAASSLLAALDFRPLEEANVVSPSASVFWNRADGQICVQSFRPGGDIFFQPHSYSEYTIVACLEGEISKTQMGHTEVVGRGGALIGNQGVDHTSGYWTRNSRRCEAVVLSVDRRLLGGLARELRLPVIDNDFGPAFIGRVESPVIHDCARTIADELRQARPGHQIIVETLSVRMMVETLREWPRSGIESVPASLTPRLPRRDFVRAHEFMRWCRKDNFRVQNLCRMLGSSEERFVRLFQASTSQTPAKFYNRMLLERARELLREPRRSVKEIGYELGFKTSSHFIQAFRLEFATTPQEYRENQGGMASVTVR